MIDAQAAEDKAVLEFQRREEEYRRARGKTVYCQYCLANGGPLPREDEDEDKFDPFPDRPPSPLPSVDWEGGPLSPLLHEINPERPHPAALKDKHHPKPDEDSFYVSKYQTFNEIFTIEAGQGEGAGVDMATLCDMLKYSVVDSGVQER